MPNSKETASSIPALLNSFDPQMLKGIKITPEQRLERACAADNMRRGSLTDYDCPLCLNKGIVFKIVDGEERAFECECMPLRASKKRVRESGLENILKRCSFENFAVNEPWQKKLLTLAESFCLEAQSGDFFYTGGQSGAGKTHICTAIAGRLLENGANLRYLKWAEELPEILSLSANEERKRRYACVNPLKTVEVLYIDDFLRTAKPSVAELKLAFEIINARYSKGLTTVISSEKTIEQLLNTDDAVGGRILERTGERWLMNLACDTQKNARLNKKLRQSA